MADDFENLQQKEMELDLDKVPEDQREDVKAEVGQYIVDSILEKLAKGDSPVSGENFKDLSKKYADKYKGGNRNPNLELEGDLLAALGFETTSDGILVGIMDDSQRPKADGHNHFTSASKNATAPKRRFIPGSSQNFKRDIQRGIQDIIDSFADTQAELDVSDPGENQDVSSSSTSGGPTSISLNNILSNESLADIILRRIRGR